MVKTDYSEEIEQLIVANYEPAEALAEDVQALSLQNIHYQVTQILPSTHIDESDVWQVLKKLGYQPKNLITDQLAKDEKGEHKTIKVATLSYLFKFKN